MSMHIPKAVIPGKAAPGIVSNREDRTNGSGYEKFGVVTSILEMLVLHIKSSVNLKG
ncbi:hypothetical protein ACFSCZ_11460 [Siminovitchia sediminis]|uniref:Uncharacterized protein n=1 Tax=Siminovitchia sediminis TaxID=1274353 RepID=A0ABW4KJH3_9BACI